MVGRPGPVDGWDEKIQFDLREESSCIILHEPILSQKIAAKYRMLDFRTNKCVRKELSSQVDLSLSCAEGRNDVAPGAGQLHVGRPSAMQRLTLRP